MSGEDEWVCPACGKPDSELPIGHSVAWSFSYEGPPTCRVMPPPDPDIIDQFLAALSPHAYWPVAPAEGEGETR